MTPKCPKCGLALFLIDRGGARYQFCSDAEGCSWDDFPPEIRKALADECRTTVMDAVDRWESAEKNGDREPMSQTLTPKERIERAREMVSDLCQQKRRWIMSIPAEPNHDPDIVISAGLVAGREALDRLAEVERDGTAVSIRLRVAEWDKAELQARLAAVEAELDMFRNDLTMAPCDGEYVLMCSSEAAAQILRLRAERDALLSGTAKRDGGERLFVRDACRKRQPLDGTDAQALEHALTMTERERDAAVLRARSMEGSIRLSAIAGGTPTQMQAFALQALKDTLDEVAAENKALRRQLHTLALAVDNLQVRNSTPWDPEARPEGDAYIEDFDGEFVVELGSFHAAEDICCAVNEGAALAAEESFTPKRM